MNLQEGVSLEIVRAEYENEYRVEVEFNDGHHITVDFDPFLSKSRNLETQQFLDRALFRTFRIEYGNMVWGDYEMCFPIEDLYRGELIKRQHLAVAEEREEYGKDER